MKDSLIKLFANKDFEIYFVYEDHYNRILYFDLHTEHLFEKDTSYYWRYSDISNYEFYVPKYFSLEVCHHILNNFLKKIKQIFGVFFILYLIVKK